MQIYVDLLAVIFLHLSGTSIGSLGDRLTGIQGMLGG